MKRDQLSFSYYQVRRESKLLHLLFWKICGFGLKFWKIARDRSY
jgi:hypothetical protein